METQERLLSRLERILLGPSNNPVLGRTRLSLLDQGACWIPSTAPSGRGRAANTSVRRRVTRRETEDRAAIETHLTKILDAMNAQLRDWFHLATDENPQPIDPQVVNHLDDLCDHGVDETDIEPLQRLVMLLFQACRMGHSLVGSVCVCGRVPTPERDRDLP